MTPSSMIIQRCSATGPHSVRYFIGLLLLPTLKARHRSHPPVKVIPAIEELPAIGTHTHSRWGRKHAKMAKSSADQSWPAVSQELVYSTTHCASILARPGERYEVELYSLFWCTTLLLTPSQWIRNVKPRCLCVSGASWQFLSGSCV